MHQLFYSLQSATIITLVSSKSCTHACWILAWTEKFNIVSFFLFLSVRNSSVRARNREEESEITDEFWLAYGLNFYWRLLRRQQKQMVLLLVSIPREFDFCCLPQLAARSRAACSINDLKNNRRNRSMGRHLASSLMPYRLSRLNVALPVGADHKTRTQNIIQDTIWYSYERSHRYC